MFEDIIAEFFSWTRGGLLLLFLLNFGLYIQNKRKLFLNYSLYLLFIFLCFLKPLMPVAWSGFYDVFEHSLFFLSFVFYVEFVRILLSSKYTIPKWDRYLVIEKYTLLFLSCSLPFVYFLVEPKTVKIYILFSSNIITVFSVWTYFVIFKIKGRNVFYFISGSATFLVLGNIGTYVKVIFRNDIDSLGFEPTIFTYLGVIFEALIFTNIIGNMFKEIREKKVNLKIQFALKQKEAAELKMTALRSQMNPHFLFNSLNSINNFVLKSEKEKASDYITDFSKLIRLTLKNSERSEISMFEEIEVLETYIGLEKTRLSGGFVFIKEIDNRLDLHNIFVPPLFLQPYIENSIWHGLAGKEGEKRIKLEIQLDEDRVVICIEDNGIGINDEMIAKNRKSSKRKFFGSYATEKRIKLMYNSDYVDIFTQNISDNCETGTRVTVKFPVR
ncbi:histidine kinase [Flavicella sp.]|uniref:sensor histidine kinase n=1 Tax=Flavicella sp. TaxID=2957742 RepID=UPI00301AFD46